MSKTTTKIQQDIDSTKKRIAVLKSKLSQLEAEKEKIENEEIVSLVRSLQCTPGDIREIIQAIKKNDISCLTKFAEKRDDLK